MGEGRDGAGWRRSTTRIVGAVVAFAMLVAVVNPLGAALERAGLSRLSTGVVLVLTPALVIGVVIVLAFRRRHGVEADQTAELAALAVQQLTGWRQASWTGPIPAVLAQPRLERAQVLAAVVGTLEGRPAIVAAWRRDFRNRGAAVSMPVHHLTITVTGLRPDAAVALGKVSTPGMAGLGTHSPLVWAGGPPRALMTRPADRPWGLLGTAYWPGAGVPAVAAWADIAAELDDLSGWLILDGGRLDISAVAEEPLPTQLAQRLVALADLTIARAVL